MFDERISHYRIVGKLGMGGMGVVYDAQDERLPRRVALKFLPEEMAEDADAARRLRREAETVALLNHPHICTIYDVEEHKGRVFIVMERLEGSNLKVHMARTTLETPQVIRIALQITRALGAAHAKGIVHRDIKPGNIYIDRSEQVKVLDFGLARRLPAEAPAAAPDGSTIPGRPLGTASYMAPERILQLPLDARGDLFSLGVVIYEMATGRLPFTAASPAETVTNILEKAPVPLTKLSPARPIQLERIVDKLLAKRADDRFQTAGEVEQELLTFHDRAGNTLIRRVIGRVTKRP